MSAEAVLNVGESESGVSQEMVLGSSVDTQDIDEELLSVIHMDPCVCECVCV